MVTREQFEITDQGITHVPTGYSFRRGLGDPFDGHVNKGHLGNQLPSGEEYRPDDVEEMARRLWAEYIRDKT